MVSRVGRDTLGEDLLSGLRDLDFDLALVQEDAVQPTGTVGVTLSGDGNPSFIINTGVAYDYLEATPALLTAARDASLISLGTLVQRSEKARNTVYAVLEAATQATKFLDINLRKNCYTAETVSESLRRADILKLNTSEVTVVSELLQLSVTTPKEVAQTVMHTYGIKTVIITLGAEGVYAIDAQGGECTVPGVSINVVDTIGSGDSFAAGFVFTYLQGRPLDECCHFGNLIGALNATKKGGMPNISPDELATFLAQHQKAAES
jgi:fructokinase